MQQLLRIENIYHLHLFGFIVVFFFFIQSGESIYEPPQIQFYFESKIKLLLLIDISKPVWYLERSYSKTSLTTSFALSFVITATLLLFKYYFTDCFFFSITTTFIFDTIVIPKITYSSYWFKVIFFFLLFEMYPNISNYSNYSIFNSSIFFIQFKKILILLIMFSSDCFFPPTYKVLTHSG